jgi:hypothetical protein
MAKPTRRPVHQRGSGQAYQVGLREAVNELVRVHVLCKFSSLNALKHAKEIILAPHHTFRLARRTTGVQQVQVISGSPPRCFDSNCVRRCGLAVGHGPFRAMRFGSDSQPRSYVRQPTPESFHCVGELGFEYHRLRLAVTP